MGLGMPFYSMVLMSVFLNPALSGLNLIWIVPAVLAPVIVFRYQEAAYERSSETGST